MADRRILSAVTPGGRVLITHRLYRELQNYRQTGHRKETGGVLVGYRREDKTWVIAKIMPPSPRNKRGRFWLKRDLPDAQKFVDKIHAESGGRFTYLGEWHTHPESSPTPSALDKGMLYDILKGSQLATPFLFGLILGDTGNLCLWYQDRKGLIEIYYPHVPSH